MLQFKFKSNENSENYFVDIFIIKSISDYSFERKKFLFCYYFSYSIIAT